MLDKKIDLLIFGHNFYSLLLGIEQTKSGKSVLLIDDLRSNFSSFFMRQLSEWDRQLLVKFGQSLDIDSLVNLDHFMQIGPCFYQFGHFRIRLGDLPFRNFSELCRRFNFAFSRADEPFEAWCTRHQLTADSFNHEYSKYIEKLVADFFQRKASGSFDLSYFLRSAPLFLQDIFNTFSLWEKQKDRADSESCNLRSLLSALRSQFQQNLSSHYNSSDLFFLFLMMLSPHFRLDNIRLNEALKLKFESLKGEVRKVEMGEWLFENGKPWAVNLSSFEGIVMPKNEAIVGNLSPTFPLEIDSSSPYFSSLVFQWKLSPDAERFIPSQSYCFAHPERLGTDYPFFFMEKKSDGSYEFRVFYANSEGCKKEFLLEELREEVLKHLESAFNFKRWLVLEEVVSQGGDIILSYKIDRDRLPLTSHANPSLFNTSIINHKEVVDQVAYYGTFRCFAMGKISLIKALCPSIGAC